MLKHYLLGRRNGIGLIELINRLFRPSAIQRAKAQISEILYLDEWLVVNFHKPTGSLYWPKEVDFKWLYQVIAEIFYPDDWHYYEWDRTSIDKDDIVVDCGSAEGLFSLIVSQRCKMVYSIEPLPIFLSAQKMTFEKKENVKILPFGLSDLPGKARLDGSGITAKIVSSQSNDLGVPITISTLDDLFFKKDIPVTYLKADLEGYELKMLEGAKNSIAAYSPKIAITTYHKANHAKQISDFITTINSKYHIKVKGIEQIWGGPVMLHAWIE